MKRQSDKREVKAVRHPPSLPFFLYLSSPSPSLSIPIETIVAGMEDGTVLYCTVLCWAGLGCALLMLILGLEGRGSPARKIVLSDLHVIML